MTTITQKGRTLRLVTPVGDDVLLAEHFSGVEGLSRPFHYEVSCLADVAAGNHAKVDPKKLLGEPVTIEVNAVGQKYRTIHGIVRRFRAGPVDEVFARFELEVVPTLSLLSLTSDSRIFQGKTVPEVVQDVLKEGGVKVKSELTRTYTVLDYCVQYRETDYNFVARLLEQEGIFYFFEHAEKSHTMVLRDDLRKAQPCPLQDKVEYGGDESGASIRQWEERRELYTGKWTTRDFHFETPKATLEATTPALKPADAIKAFETYDYPGEYAQRFNKTGERLAKVAPEGETLGQIRMEEAESAGVQAEGISTCAAFAVGYRFSVSSLGNQTVKGSWVLSAVHHSCGQRPGYLGDDGGEGQAYTNRFTCLPADAKFRPPRVTPKPVVQGPQSARVIDESASGEQEEIWPDKYGRVRVRFPWDREAKYACWVRVAQQRAGRSGGFIWIPRVGDEVLVACIEGDPDCPVIVGSVYNADNMPPYALPANKTQSGIKSRSSPKGGAANANEFRFEDKKGSEQVYLHAEKDSGIDVKNDETHWVGHDRVRKVDNDETVTVKNDQKITVEHDQTLTVKGKQENTITGDQSTTVSQGNQNWTVKMGSQTTAIKMGDQKLTLDMGSITTQCKLGNITMKCTVGKVAIEALQGIELKVGPNSIKIDMSGITISGLMVKSEGKVQNSMEGLMCQVNGKAMLMAKGAITMIG